MILYASTTVVVVAVDHAERSIELLLRAEHAWIVPHGFLRPFEAATWLGVARVQLLEHIGRVAIGGDAVE